MNGEKKKDRGRRTKEGENFPNASSSSRPLSFPPSLLRALTTCRTSVVFGGPKEFR